MITRTTPPTPTPDLDPPTPGGGAARPARIATTRTQERPALPIRPAARCLSCQTRGGRIIGGGTRRPVPTRVRGLCWSCYYRAYSHGLHQQYPACGAVPVPYFGDALRWDEFVGIPEGHTPTLRAHPAEPAITFPVTWTYPDHPDRWSTARWLRRPTDPTAAALHDRATLDAAA